VECLFAPLQSGNRRGGRQSRCEQRVKQPYRAFSDPAQQADAELRYYGFMPPALRAAAGLPETGWEDEIRRRHGLI